MNIIKKYKNYIALGFIALLVGYILLPQLDSLKESIQALKSANTFWVLVAVGIFFSGVLALALQYMVLAIQKLHFKLTLQVECAELFVSRILPSGVGTVALNMYYLMQKKHTAAQAAAVVAANGFSNAIAYSMLIIVGLIGSNFSLGIHHRITANLHMQDLFIAVVVLIIVCALLYRVPIVNRNVKKFFKSLTSSLVGYKDKPNAIASAVLLNGAGSLTGILAIYFCAKALSVDLSIPQALLTYTAGNIMASLVPTPGGLGSAEAGIYAGLTLSGLSAVDAISVTMLYRLISYWIPLVPGYIAFWHLRKTVLSDFSLKKHAG